MSSSSPRPPAWLIWSTAALTLAILGMAVTETSQWGHYLIDKGEAISLAGLGFMLVAGLILFRQGRLRVSMPFALPWLIYPVITQGDQIIDNLSITAMQVICQVLLTLIFAVPIAVLVLAAKHGLAPGDGRVARTRSWTVLVPGLHWIEQGRVREGAAVMTLVMLTLELWVAYRLLGAFMVATLVALQLIFLWRLVHASSDAPAAAPRRTERFALVMLMVSIAASLALYVGYKNRPGAYQGSPSYLFDPSKPDAGYKVNKIAVPAGPVAPLPEALAVDTSKVLAGYADALQELADGYYILDRNYTHHFHNVLFARSWPILPNFRAVALARIADARARAGAVKVQADRLRASLATFPAASALLEEIEAYLAFNLDRAALLEPMSATFIETDDGLQHAAHLYEGEGKLLGMGLGELLDKHRATIDAPVLAQTLAPFNQVTRAIYDAYKDRVVGF